MKIFAMIGVSLLICGTGLIGCKKEESTTPVPTTTPPARTTTPTTPATLPAVQVPKIDLAPTQKDVQAKASALLEKAQTYIKENKYDLADESLKQVEAMGDSLTPSLRSRVTELRTVLKSLKSSTLNPDAIPSLNK